MTREGSLFIRNGRPYYFIDANYWVGPLLASPGESGNWERLTHDLDALQTAGVDNLRVLVGGDEACPINKNIKPFLQRLDGTYDGDLLVGLDRFMAELGRRGMTAVLYFNNSCDWSGGYVHYAKRVRGEEDSPSFWDWEAYHDYTKVMFTDRRAQEYFLNHVKNIVSRVNSVTGKAYRDDPAIFSWQIGNEPRAFFEELHPQFIDLLHETARTIRDIDPNHMINHLEVAKKLGKPLVIEEFGLIRDEGALDPDSPVAGAVTIEQAASYASKGKKPLSSCTAANTILTQPSA